MPGPVPVSRYSVGSGGLFMLGLRRQRATLMPAAEPADSPRQHRIVVGRLMLGSATMLFLELALIRWLGANVVHLSYFSNFVLLGSFLGIGLGFLRASGPGRTSKAMPLHSLVV